MMTETLSGLPDAGGAVPGSSSMKIKPLARRVDAVRASQIMRESTLGVNGNRWYSDA